MIKKITILSFIILISGFSYTQDLPENAILKNFRPFDNPRTNGRPGEIYRINEEGVKYIVQDVTTIPEKISEEGDLIGRMYFTSDELLSLLNLEFDRLEIIPAEVKIINAKREYTEQTSVDKVLYNSGKIRDLIVDNNSSYYIIREAISTKDVTFRFSSEVYSKIKRGASSLTEIKGNGELDFPFEIKKKFKKEKRIFYLEQPIQKDPYDS